MHISRLRFSVRLALIAECDGCTDRAEFPVKMGESFVKAVTEANERHADCSVEISSGGGLRLTAESILAIECPGCNDRNEVPLASNRTGRLQHLIERANRRHEPCLDRMDRDMESYRSRSEGASPARIPEVL